jgi:hypothetical protein
VKERMTEAAFIGWQVIRGLGASITLQDYLASFGLIDHTQKSTPQTLTEEVAAALAEAERIASLARHQG